MSEQAAAPTATFAIAGVVGVQENDLSVVRFEVTCPDGCRHVLAVINEHVLLNDPARGPHGNGQIYNDILEALAGYMTRRMERAGSPLLHRENIAPASGLPS